jgi:hypothetical protein
MPHSLKFKKKMVGKLTGPGARGVIVGGAGGCLTGDVVMAEAGQDG